MTALSPAEDLPHVLVVDDDRRIRTLLVSYLSGKGYRVSAAATAAEARRAMQGLAFDLMILDVMMPGESGVTFAANLRAEGNEVPILMLSARTDTQDRIKGLSNGSDDYLGKPFEPEELLLRMGNLLRRRKVQAPALRVARLGNCLFDVDTGVLTRAGAVVHLTGREKDILRQLVQNAGRPVSRVALQSNTADESARAVDVQINRLRQKIENDPGQPVLLQTVRGEGYCLYAESV